jgi:hypothetical protein
VAVLAPGPFSGANVHTHEHGITHRGRRGGGLVSTAATVLRATVLLLAAIGLVTVIGMVRTAREPYGGPLEA